MERQDGKIIERDINAEMKTAYIDWLLRLKKHKSEQMR